MGYIAVLGTEKKNNVTYYYYMDYVIAQKTDGSKGVKVNGTNVVAERDFFAILSQVQKTNGGIMPANRLMNAKATYRGTQCVGIDDCYGKFTRFQKNTKTKAGIFNNNGVKTLVIGGTGVILAEHRWIDGTIRGYTYAYQTGNPQKPWNIATLTETVMLQTCYIAKNQCDITPVQNMVYRNPNGTQGTQGAKSQVYGVLARNTEMYRLPSIEEKIMKAVRRKPQPKVNLQQQSQPVQQKPQQVQKSVQQQVQTAPVDNAKNSIIQEAQSLGGSYMKLVTHDKELTPEQMRIILDGKKEGYPTEYFASHEYPATSMDYLLTQMKTGLPDEVIGTLLSDKFTIRQMYEIVMGYNEDVDYTAYADINLSPTEMQIKRGDMVNSFKHSAEWSDADREKFYERIKNLHN